MIKEAQEKKVSVKHLPQDNIETIQLKGLINEDNIVEILEKYYQNTISPTCSLQELAIKNGIKPKVLRDLVNNNKEAKELEVDLEEKATYLYMQHVLKQPVKQAEALQELLLKRSTKVSFKFVGGKRTDIQEAIDKKRIELEANVKRNKEELEKEWQ